MAWPGAILPSRINASSDTRQFTNEFTGAVLETRHVQGEPDDEINEETDDAVETFTWTAAPSESGDPPAGLLSAYTNPLGVTTAYAYDEHGNVTTLVLAQYTGDQATLTFEYDSSDNLTAEVDALGRRTEHVYDEIGNRLSSTLPDPDGEGPLESPVYTWQYNAMTKVSLVVDPLERETEYTYGAFGNIYGQTLSADGFDPIEISFGYDIAGRQTSQTDGLSRTTSFTLDDLGRVVATTLPDPDGAGELDAPVYSQTFDPLGRPETTTDALENITSVSYSEDGRTITTTLADPDGAGPLAAPEYVSQFNLLGQLVLEVDPLGNETTYSYDMLGRLVEKVLPDPDGAGELASPVYSYVYDQANNLLSVVDPGGNTTSFVYDSLNRLTEIHLPDPETGEAASSASYSYVYDDAGQLLSETDPLGRTTLHVYDTHGREIETTLPDPDGAGELDAPIYTYSYDAAGRLILAVDPLGGETHYEYDLLDNVISLTLPDPDGAGELDAPVYTYVYNAASQLISETDPLGRTTLHSYDALGREIETTLPDPDGAGELDSPVWQYVFDAGSNLVSTIDPLANETVRAYDHLNRLVLLTMPDPDGGGALASPEYSWVYDTASRVVSEFDPLNRETSHLFDALGREIETTLPDPDGAGELESPVWSYHFDALSNLVLVVDPLLNEMAYEYDRRSRQVKITDAENGETTFTFDAADNLLSLTDPSSNTTTWTYDGLDRVIQEENELSASRYFSYDTLNNLVEKTDRNGRVTQYTVDGLGRTTEEKWLDGETVLNTYVYAFDAASQLISAADENSSLAFGYDDLGRIVGISADYAGLSPQVLMTQAFDSSNNRTHLAAYLGETADFVNEFTFDHLDRLIRLEQTGVSGGNNVGDTRVDFSYLGDNQYDSVSRYADLAGEDVVVTTDYAYDRLGRLLDLSHAQGELTLASYSYSYDARSRIISMESPADGVSQYSYDGTGQLVSAEHASQADETHSWDASGNPVGEAIDVGPNNQVLTDGTYDFEFDSEGNLTLKTTIATGESVTYAWDHRNRLTGVVNRDAEENITQETHFVYDFLDRWIGRTSDDDGAGEIEPTSLFFVYDGSQIVLELDDTESETPLHRYLWADVVDELMADEDALGDVLYPLADKFNTVRDLAEYDSGESETSVVNHLTYESFGKVLSETSATPFRFRFNSRPIDEATGLQGNGHRWFSVDLGWWLSEDPTGFGGGDTNTRRYVGNTPTNATDPTGLFIPGVSFIGGAVGAVYGAGIGVGVTTGVSLLTRGRLPTRGQVVGAMVGGAVAGAITGAVVTGDVGGAIVVGAIAGGAGAAAFSATQQAVDHGRVNPKRVMRDAAVGAITGGAASGLTAGLSSALGPPTGMSGGLAVSASGSIAIVPGRAASAALTADLMPALIFSNSASMGALGGNGSIGCEEPCDGDGTSSKPNTPKTGPRLPPKGTPERAAIEAARKKGIDGAIARELENIRSGGKGSGVWTEAELQQIRKTGEFPGDVRWHHDPTVANRPDLAGDPSVIRPVRGGTKGHLEEHGGDWRKPYPE